MKISVRSSMAPFQERGTVKTYRNKKNDRKYMEVKKSNDGHTWARQYLEYDDVYDEPFRNYVGSKSPKGRYFRHRQDSLNSILDDYDEVREEAY